MPLLWEIFFSDISSTDTRKIEMVLTHKPEDFFSLVRNLYVRKPFSTSEDAWNLKFPQLITAIAPQSLAKVIVADAVDSGTLGLLIMRQQNLSELSVPIRKGQPLDRAYVNGNLQSLVKLSMFAYADQVGYEAWLSAMSMLETLTVSSKRPLQVSIFMPWTITPKMQRLKNLDLHNLTLQPSSGRIDKWTDIQRLGKLTIRDCKGIDNFLKAFISAHTDARHRCHLTALAISESADTNWMISSDNLLYITIGLKYLYLSSSCSEMPLLYSLGSHRDHLAILLLDPVNDWSETTYIDAGDAKRKCKDLSKLPDACPLLEELGTSLVLVDLDVDRHWEKMEPWIFGLDVDSTYVEAQIVKQLVSQHIAALNIDSANIPRRN